MAIQANMYQENLGLPVSSQDYFFVQNNNFNNNNNNIDMNYISNNNLLFNECGLDELKFLQQQQLQFQQQQQQQQQEYLFHLQNLQKKNSCMINNNDNSFMFSQPSKKQKLATTTVTTASTTTSESGNNNRNYNYYQNHNILMGFSRSFSAEVEKQSQEIDRFVTLQNERLRLALQEQRRQQMVTIIKKIEANALKILQQKDEQIAEATKKSMEFQKILEKLELENQVWQKVALENESMVVSLNNTLAQLKQQQQQNQEVFEDQEDVCSSSSNCVVDEKEETCKFQETKKGNLEFCKMCNSRKMCVVLLPCRHLCCCSVCNADVENCPVCNSPKKASVEVLI